MKFFLSLLFLLAFANCFSQKLVSSKLLPCHAIGEVTLRERIASQTFSHDTLYLEINFTHNCDIDLEPSLHAGNDSLFIDLKNVSNIYAACNCCYSMVFTIAGVTDSSYKIFVNDREFHFSKSRYVDVPPRNIPKEWCKNEINSEGLKIGYWKTRIKKTGNTHLFYYGDGSKKDNPILWGKVYSKKGVLTSVAITIEEGSESYLYDIGLRMYEQILQENER
ncbi:MAG: hypothetical protein ACO1N0_02765 [Fluviicola sp.]